MHVADSSKNAIHGAFKFMCATFKNKFNENAVSFVDLHKNDCGRRKDTETTTRILLIRLSESWDREVSRKGRTAGEINAEELIVESKWREFASGSLLLRFERHS